MIFERIGHRLIRIKFLLGFTLILLSGCACNRFDIDTNTGKIYATRGGISSISVSARFFDSINDMRKFYHYDIERLDDAKNYYFLFENNPNYKITFESRDSTGEISKLPIMKGWTYLVRLSGSDCSGFHVEFMIDSLGKMNNFNFNPQ